MGFASWQRYCTASSSGRQPNFAALNRGRHLCSTRRPSRWALAHSSSIAINYHCIVDVRRVIKRYDSRSRHGCVMALGKLFTPLWPCHQAVCCNLILVSGQWMGPANCPSSAGTVLQGAYNSEKPGKHGNLREFVHSGKLREFEIYSGNSCILDATFSWHNL